MIVKRLFPSGYCSGVINALKIIDDNIDNDLFILGSVIHNKHVNNQLKEKGVTVLEGSPISLIDKVEGIAVITAHGVSPKVYEKLREKNICYLDTTCPYVKKIHNQIKDKINEGYEILYIGKKNHPETEAVLGLGNINLICSPDDVRHFEGKLYLTNQTTLSSVLVDEIIKKVQECNDCLIDCEICDATKKRQEAIINQEQCDLCIIIGDHSSSNANELYNISKSVRNSILIEDVKDLEDFDFTDINFVNVSAASSTPKEIIEQVITYLEKK